MNKSELREKEIMSLLRVSGKVNVNEVASVFGGGGHILASGCMICGFYEDVKDKIIKAVSDAL